MTTKSLKGDLALARLLQLSSVSLPVGGYAFSQGIEYAIECGWVKDADGVEEWVSLQMRENLARVDLPILRGSMLSTSALDWSKFSHLNDLVIASRETKELRLTDTAMGEALYRLLKSLEFDIPTEADLFAKKGQDLSFVALFGFAAAKWEIDYHAVAMGFTWSWLENQIAAATKLVPLGQTQAQRLLTKLQPAIGQTIEFSEHTLEENIGGGLPALAMASALHETQYSRLFRS